MPRQPLAPPSSAHGAGTAHAWTAPCSPRGFGAAAPPRSGTGHARPPQIHLRRGNGKQGLFPWQPSIPCIRTQTRDAAPGISPAPRAPQHLFQNAPHMRIWAFGGPAGDQPWKSQVIPMGMRQPSMASAVAESLISRCDGHS